MNDFPQHRPRFSIVYFLFVVIIGIIAIIFIAFRQEPAAEQEVYIRAQIPATSEVVTYEHPTVGFSFARPEGFSVTELESTDPAALDQVSVLCCEPPNPRIDIYFGNHAHTADTDPGTKISAGVIMIDNEEATRTVWKRETLRGMENVTSIVVTHAGITYTLESSLKDEFDVIVRSFTFPEEGASP